MVKRITLQQAQHAVGQQREWAYNAIDTISTYEISNVLDKSMDAVAKRTHDFYVAVQGPAVEMTTKGIKVDNLALEETVYALKKELTASQRNIAKNEQITSVWDRLEKVTGICQKSTRKDAKHTWEKGVPDGPERVCTSCGRSRMKIAPFNPKSDNDLKHLFYDLFKMKKQLNKDGNVTTDKEARGKLKAKYKRYEALIDEIDTFADKKKQLEFLAFRQTSDGRFKAGFNVGVTSTGRWSSNKDPFGHGANAQNITERHRHVFVADDGYELCYADLKQAESNIIAHEAGDEQYIEAHIQGDTHTYVTRLVWPEGVGGKPWTGDIKADKKIATSARPSWDDRPGHDYRFQSKAVQHGSNLGLTAFGLAIQKHIPVDAARDAQKRYFRAFPGIREYQRDIRQHVEAQEPITNSLGVRFRLFGRPWDEHTVKQGLAIKPQSTVGHIIGIGCWRIQRELPEVQLLAQVHDAILFQFPKGRYDMVYQALECMTVPIPITGQDGVTRVATVGTEAAVGHNWGHASEHNPQGLREIVFKSPTEWSIK